MKNILKVYGFTASAVFLSAGLVFAQDPSPSPAPPQEPAAAEPAESPAPEPPASASPDDLLLINKIQTQKNLEQGSLMKQIAEKQAEKKETTRKKNEALAWQILERKPSASQ